jgi:GT2 family glycosyltransferase
VSAGAGGVVAVVVTCNRRDVVLRCLEKLFSADASPGRVLVIDNESTDGTADAIREAFPAVSVREMGHNVGPAGGFAVGMDLASRLDPDWLFVLDDDCFVEQDTLGCLLDIASRAPAAVAVLASSTEHGGKRNVGYRWRNRPVPLTDNGQQWPEMVDVDMVTFTGALIRTSAAKSVGLPRADYFTMCWEWEYFLRLRRSGLRICVVPRASVHHDTLGSPAGASTPSRGYYQARNGLRLALDRGRPVEVLHWGIREVKLVGGILLFLDRKGTRLRLRLRGAVDAMRGRMGHTVSDGGSL